MKDLAQSAFVPAITFSPDGPIVVTIITPAVQRVADLGLQLRDLQEVQNHV